MSDSEYSGAVSTETDELLSRAFEEVESPYDYEAATGAKIDLHPESRLTKFLLKRVEDMRERGRSAVVKMHPEWSYVDESCQSFMPVNEEEGKLLAEDERRPVAIIMPTMSATKTVAKSYLFKIFMRDPIFQYDGPGSVNRFLGAAMMQQLIAQQGIWFRHPLAFDTLYDDALSYGRGLLHATWAKHRREVTVRKEVDDIVAEILASQGLQAVTGDILRYMHEKTVQEGVEFVPLDPWHTWVDPSAPGNAVDKGQYILWDSEEHVFPMMADEDDEEQKLFNMMFVRMLCHRKEARDSKFSADESARSTRAGGSYVSDARHEGDDLATFTGGYIELIPNEWKIGRETYGEDRPHTYRVKIANNRVVVQLDRVSFDHGKFPVLSCCPTNGRDTIPVSFLMGISGMARYVDWAIKADWDNVRKAINDITIVNPMYVEPDDVLNPGPGKLIRLRNLALGNYDIKNIISQYPVTDITKGNVDRAWKMIEMIRWVTGTTNAVIGDYGDMPDKMGSQGAQQAFASAVSNMEFMAQVINYGTMIPAAALCGHMTNQFLDEEFRVSVLGSQYEEQFRMALGMESGQNYMTVGPQDLDPDFQVVPKTAMTPKRENLPAMAELLKTFIAAAPEAVAEFAPYVKPLTKYYAKESGCDVLNQIDSVRVMQQEEIAKLQAQGRIVNTNATGAPNVPTAA